MHKPERIFPKVWKVFFSWYKLEAYVMIVVVSTQTHSQIQVLKEAGAVPFVKTSTPHAAFSLLCSNPITGETTHPMDSSRTPGGSSGQYVPNY